jgi:hypothetical protein
MYINIFIQSLLYSLHKHDIWCNILYSRDLLYHCVLCWVITCSWQWWYSSSWWLHICCYLLWWSYVLMYECTHMVGGCIKLSLLDWLGGGLVNGINMCPNLSSVHTEG